MQTPVAHQLSMTVLMTPDMANFSGNVHGGHILKLTRARRRWKSGSRSSPRTSRRKSVRHANSCFFTMVAVNEDGRPVQIPARVPATPDERRRHEAAKARRELRRELEARYGAMKTAASPAD